MTKTEIDRRMSGITTAIDRLKAQAKSAPKQTKIVVRARLFSWGNIDSYTPWHSAVLHDFESEVTPGTTVRFGTVDLACEDGDFESVSAGPGGSPCLEFEFQDGSREVAHVLQYHRQPAMSPDFGGQGGEGPCHSFTYCFAACRIAGFAPAVR